MNTDQILAQRKLETFTVDGTAPNVVLADQQAWAALESVLGTDPIEAWLLKAMQHVFIGDEARGSTASIAFKAEFVRTPDEEA